MLHVCTFLASCLLVIGSVAFVPNLPPSLQVNKDGCYTGTGTGVDPCYIPKITSSPEIASPLCSFQKVVGDPKKVCQLPQLASRRSCAAGVCGVSAYGFVEEAGNFRWHAYALTLAGARAFCPQMFAGSALADKTEVATAGNMAGGLSQCSYSWMSTGASTGEVGYWMNCANNDCTNGCGGNVAGQRNKPGAVPGDLFSALCFKSPSAPTIVQDARVAWDVAASGSGNEANVFFTPPESNGFDSLRHCGIDFASGASITGTAIPLSFDLADQLPADLLADFSVFCENDYGKSPATAFSLGLSANSPLGAPSTQLCRTPRSLPKAQFAKQAANLCAWQAPSPLPVSTTEPVDDFTTYQDIAAQLSDGAISQGQEVIEGQTFDYVELRHNNVGTSISYKYGGVDGNNFVAKSDQVIQGHMLFHLVQPQTGGEPDDITGTPFGFLIPFAYDVPPENVNQGLAIFAMFSDDQVALGMYYKNGADPSMLLKTAKSFRVASGVQDGLADGRYHTLDLVLNGPAQTATLFLDGAEVLSLDRADLDKIKETWTGSNGAPYTRWGDAYSHTNGTLRVSEFSVFAHSGITVSSSCAPVAPLTGKSFEFQLTCLRDRGVWTDNSQEAARQQCLETSSPCDILLNGGQVAASRAPQCTADGWRLSDDEWLDVSAATMGSFGTSDFRASFDFRSAVADVAIDGPAANIFIRSSEVPFPYSGPTMFFRDGHNIQLRQSSSTPMTTGFDCVDCQPDWQNWHTYTIEQFNGTLSLWIDGALKDSVEVEPTLAQFVTSAPLRFGGNHGAPTSQNTDGWLKNIRLDDKPFRSCVDQLVSLRQSSASSMMRWCSVRDKNNQL